MRNLFLTNYYKLLDSDENMFCHCDTRENNGTQSRLTIS